MRKLLLTLTAAALAMEGSSRHKMKVTFGDLITSGSGSAGGHTYSRNRGGAYRKNKPIPLQPNSQAQQAIKSGLSNFAQQWRDLTQEQRDSWNAAAKQVTLINSLGRPYTPTGINYFTQLNQNINNWNTYYLSVPATPLPNIYDPPTFFSPVPFSLNDFVMNFTGSIGTIGVTFDNPTTGNVFFEFDLSAGVSAGINNIGGNYRFVRTNGLFSTAAAAPLYAAYLAIFGAQAPGTKIFLRVRCINVDTGQVGQYQTISTIAL